MAIQRFSVSNDDGIYEAFPDLILTNGGKLICVFIECINHGNRNNNRIVIRESHDRGRTWSAKKPLTEICDHANSFDCPRISKLHDGSLVIVCNKLHRDGSKIYLWRGDPEGESWSEPYICPFRGNVPDKLLELKNGRWILAAQTTDGSQLEQYLWYSDDQGKTWSERVTVAADKRYELCEVSILEYDNNILVAFLREESCEGYDMMKVISYDNGETWSEVYNLPLDAGLRPVAGFLNDGTTVMVTYRYRPCCYFHSATNVFAGFLRKEDLLKVHRQEHEVRIMPLDYDRNTVPDLGYTGWVQFADDEIYVVCYIMDDSDKAQIRGYSFYPEDVVLPRKEKTKAIGS